MARPAYASVLAGCGFASLGAALVAAACVIPPPPDVPNAPLRAPRILHDSVSPPADVPLASWPQDFLIPLQIDSPIESFVFEAFVDYNAPTQGNSATAPVQGPVTVPVSPLVLDGGVMWLPVAIDSRNFDLGICHRIEVMVALGFAQAHTPGSPGDTVTWRYEGAGAPYGCPQYDAGAYQDGFSSPPDASDALPVSPEAGARP